MISEIEAGWRPSRLQAWWAGLPDIARGWGSGIVNPDNQTRIHLAHLIARRPGQIMVAPTTYGRPKIRFPETGARLVIGRYGSIADRVEILLGGNHRLDWLTTYPFAALPGLWPEAATLPSVHAPGRDVVIGHDVWIGSQVMILPGVAIGHGAVIAARSVVVRNVAPYQIVGGNPAGPIRARFEPDIAARLLALAWWDWPDRAIRRAMPALTAGDVAALEALSPPLQARASSAS